MMSHQESTLEQFRVFADQAPCGIALFDLETSEPVVLNKAYYELVGYTPKEYQQEKPTMDQLILPVDMGISRQIEDEFQRTGRVHGQEYRIRRRDGETRWIRLDLSSFSIDGVSYAFADFVDITAEKDACAQLNLVSENTANGVSIFRIKEDTEELIYANDGFFRMTGLDRTYYMKNLHAIDMTVTPGMDRERLLAAVREAVRTGKPGDVEHRRVRTDGTIQWLNRHYCAVPQDDGTYLLISVVSDISARKNAELKMALEQQRFQLVIDELHAAVFEWNLQDKTFYASEAYGDYALSQVSSDDILHNRGPRDLVHADDQAELQRFFQQTVSCVQRAETVLRLKMTSGEFHWCHIIGLYYRDEQGQGERTVGVIIDVNEERERSFMLNSLLNEMPGGVGIFSFGKESKCEYFSDGFAEISGRTREDIDELLARNVLLDTVVAPMDRIYMMNSLRRLVAEGSPINLTFRYMLKDGTIRWMHLAGSKMREENGNPVYYCVFTTPSEESSLYRSIVEDSSSGIFVASRSTRRVLYMNSAIGKLFDISQELIRQRVDRSEQISDSFVFLTQQDVDGLQEDSYTEFHVAWQGKLHLEIKAKALHWNGIDAYIMYFKDETAEIMQKARLQRLIDEVPTGIGIYEVRDGVPSMIYLNDAYYAMLGWTREDRKQFYGENALMATYEEDRGVLYAGIQRMVQGASKTTMLHRVQNRAGRWIWLNLTASVVEREEHFLRIYAAFYDCDDIMRAQQELQNNRTCLQAALDSAQVLEWRYDFRRKIITDSGTLGQRYHWARRVEDVPKAVEKVIRTKWIHPDSVTDFLWLYEHCGDGVRVQRDLRFRSVSGDQYVWLRVIFSPIVDEKGECVECIGTAVDITEQKEKEQSYEEQLRLKKLMAKDAVAVATCNLTQNRVIETESRDPVLKKLMDTDNMDELLARIRDNCFCAQEAKDFTPVMDCATMRRGFENGVSHVEISHHLRDDTRWMQSSFDIVANPYTGETEAIATLRDITDEVRAELVVNRLLSVDYESIVTIDAATGRTYPFRHRVEGNEHKALTDCFQPGDDRDTAMERFYQAFGLPGDMERAIAENKLANVKAQLEKIPVFESLHSICEEGQVRHKRLMYAYMEENKTVILCAVQDVTDAFEQEEKQKAALSQALHTAQEASRSKTEFLSRMSHDMRTPMNGILGLAQLSEDETDAAKLKANMAQVKESGDYLLSLINDTLDFQRIESGKMQLNQQVVHAAQVFAAMTDMIKLAAEEKGVTFVIVNHNADMNWYVRIDPIRIKQVFINLISNAIKFTPAGGQVTMDIQMLSRNGLISSDCVKIIDTGIGMSEDFVKNHLFKPFEQEKSEVSSQYAGSGLGLSIVHSLVEMMGGRIEVESRLGQGTTFTVYLDFERVPEEEAAKLMAQSQTTQSNFAEKLAGKHLLLVEDHPLNAQIARKMLEKIGCHVRWEDNGEKGVAAFAASAPGELDGILMDIRMPVLNGLDAAKKIRAMNRPDAKTIPILAMTANAYDDDVRTSLDAGMNAHLAKPIDAVLLYETLCRCIGDRKE